VCEEVRPSKVKLQFHYQTGDLSVKNYVLDELYPSYRDIEEIFDLELIAFGETTFTKDDSDKYVFTCPNGDNECIGNKIHVSIETNVNKVYNYFCQTVDVCHQRVLA
jgi:hypothetical protein